MAESMDQDQDMPVDPLPLQQDLTCPVCQGVFQDPVLLPCTHSFCRECLQQLQHPRCPVCRSPFEESQQIANRALSDACASFLRQASWGATRRPPADDALCNLHLKPLELYCEKDEGPVCVECVALHNTHRLWPLTDGAKWCKKELGYIVKIFEKKLSSHKALAHELRSATEHIKVQAKEAEQQIKTEFERLRQALNREEARRLQDLANEEAQKSKTLEDLVTSTSKDVVALKKLIDNLRKEMGNEDLPLVQNFQNLKREAQWTRKDPLFTADALLNTGKHVGGLSFNIWKSMQDHITYNPVVLDPNTASPWLSLSADLTTVKESAERLVVPGNADRFDPCVFVLGAEGYTSGKHKWDIVVGDSPKWVVGVCKESVVRKKRFTISTHRGVWSIAFSKGVYTVLTPERTELQVQQAPERIRIKLNMDKGEVSFWDGGTAKHLVTLTHKFDEKMFPIFGPGLSNAPMILAPGKMAVHTS